MPTPTTRQDAASADYHAWLVGTLDWREFVKRTAERINEVRNQPSKEAGQ